MTEHFIHHLNKAIVPGHSLMVSDVGLAYEISGDFVSAQRHARKK